MEIGRRNKERRRRCPISPSINYAIQHDGSAGQTTVDVNSQIRGVRLLACLRGLLVLARQHVKGGVGGLGYESLPHHLGETSSNREHRPAA